MILKICHPFGIIIILEKAEILTPNCRFRLFGVAWLEFGGLLHYLEGGIGLATNEELPLTNLAAESRLVYLVIDTMIISGTRSNKSSTILHPTKLFFAFGVRSYFSIRIWNSIHGLFILSS